jgi:hypothetical protein
MFWYNILNAGDTLVVNYTELCYGGSFCKRCECAGPVEERNIFRETVMSTLGGRHIRQLFMVVYFFMYRNAILSENSHHSSLRTFRMTGGSAALAVFPCGHESGSTRFSSAYCS